jgi:hypothetical protein
MLHNKLGNTIATQKGSPQDAAPDSAQQLLHQKGGQEMLHKICSRDLASNAAHKFGKTIAAQEGSPQDAAQDSARRSGQQLLHQSSSPPPLLLLSSSPPPFLLSLLLLLSSSSPPGGQEMLHKICSRDVASNDAPQIWSDDRDTKRFATRCCTRFCPEI